ncbi:unnamed protein product [Haemonchus placei]|uniref:PUM-HD domain-containing protein n=1 Tax=Haemonchus placei TaxID=6290 RepID=A0A0N4VUG5_HAEPC|nr:unnamed protein product [Haemonchus placei]
MAALGARLERKKKMKGKKKVKNLLDKKAKGLKLNQVDRKRIMKLEEKKKFKDELNASVKAEMSKLRLTEDENVDETINIDPTSPSPLPEKTKDKRVSFSGNMERVKVFDKNVKDLKIKPSSASPGKGILRAIPKKVSPKKKKKKSEMQTTESEVLSETAPAIVDPSAEKENVEEKTEKKLEKPKKKITIQVTKKVKEQLLTMDRKQRKAFLRELKAQKNPNHDRAMECKLLWEKIRSKKTPKQERDEHVSKLFGLVKGFASKLIYTHDISRVFECLLAQKRPGITSALFEELTPELVRMTKSKYAHFFVLRMLKYGTKDQRDTIINSFRGHAVSLMRIVYAAEVLEVAYNEYANAQQRFDIVSEFYGKEFVLFRVKQNSYILSPWKYMLKTTVRLSLCHRLLRDFASHCDPEQLTNLIDSLKDRIPEIVHTPDGSCVAMKCIWNANVKDRKVRMTFFIPIPYLLTVFTFVTGFGF